jgi:hypothetical protein
VLYLGDSGGCEGMQRRIFEASWGVTDRAFIGHSSGVEHKDSTAKSISNSSLEAMILLGFVKGEKFLIRF